MSKARAFYDGDRAVVWGRPELPHEHRVVSEWIARVDAPGPTLELGCGAGALAGLGSGYIALDLGFLPVRRNGRRGVVADMQAIPFRDATIGSIVSVAALEHVPQPEHVLAEITRVLRGGGVAVLAPAWHCRPWAAEGLAFRPYAALNFRQKFQKALIPLRDAIWWRALFELPRRVLRERRATRGPIEFEYDRLTPNLDEYMGTDSDAFTGMDPQAMAVWFASRGWDVLSHRTRGERMRARHEAVVVRKP